MEPRWLTADAATILMISPPLANTVIGCRHAIAMAITMIPRYFRRFDTLATRYAMVPRLSPAIVLISCHYDIIDVITILRFHIIAYFSCIADVISLIIYDITLSYFHFFFRLICRRRYFSHWLIYFFSYCYFDYGCILAAIISCHIAIDGVSQIRATIASYLLIPQTLIRQYFPPHIISSFSIILIHMLAIADTSLLIASWPADDTLSADTGWAVRQLLAAIIVLGHCREGQAELADKPLARGYDARH